MLFSCVWPDGGPESLIVDAKDAENAKRMATDVAGAPPRLVVAWAVGTFVAAVRFTEDLGEDDEDADDDEIVMLEPLPHVADLLEAIEDAEDEAEARGAASGEVCEESAVFEGVDVACVLARGHDGAHEGHAPDGAPIEW